MLGNSESAEGDEFEVQAQIESEVERQEYGSHDTRIYRVHDGETVIHYVIAESPVLALAMWEIYMRDECCLDSTELDVGADTPKVVKVGPAEARSLRYTCEDEGDLGTLWDEYLRDRTRRHLSCSEW